MILQGMTSIWAFQETNLGLQLDVTLQAYTGLKRENSDQSSDGDTWEHSSVMKKLNAVFRWSCFRLKAVIFREGVIRQSLPFNFTFVAILSKASPSPSQYHKTSATLNESIFCWSALLVGSG